MEDRGHAYELQIEEIPSPQISFDNYISHHILAEPLYEEMCKKDEIFKVKLVPE